MASLPTLSAASIEEIGFLHFAVTEAMFISARLHMLTAVEATRRTPAALLEVITQQTVEAVDHYAEALASHLDWVEERILADEVSFDRQIIGRVRRVSHVSAPAARHLALAHPSVRARHRAIVDVGRQIADREIDPAARLARH